MASGADIVNYAKTFVGVPYVYGGESPHGFDCSGLVQYVYHHFGLSVPRTSAEQARIGTPVGANQLAPGDLIFSNWDGSGRSLSDVSHVAIYAGGGNIIEAPEPGKSVHVIPYSSSYASHTIAIRRLGGVGGGATNFGLTDAIGGVLGNLFPGESQITGGNLNPSDIVGAIKGVGTALDTMAKSMAEMPKVFDMFLKLLDPTVDLRIISGFFGVAFTFTGVWFIVREVR